MATSWATAEIQRIMSMDGVIRVVGHQCQLGAESEDGHPIKKPTGFMTNARGIAKTLNNLCKGRGGDCTRPQGGRHTKCRGKIARRAAIFPMKLRRAILAGFRDQLRIYGIWSRGEVGM